MFVKQILPFMGVLFQSSYCCGETFCCFVNNNHFNRQASKIHVARRLKRGPEGPGSLTRRNCHSGAIYRGPLMLYTKYQGSSTFLQEFFQDFLILLFLNQICPRQGPILY